MKQPFIITIIQSVAALQFRLADRILEVQGRQGLFHPLCSNSMRKEYVKEICTNTDSSFESFAFVSIPSRLTYSIGCVGNSECFAYPSTYCKKGVIISCYRKSCSDGMILVGNVCVDIGLKVFPGYAEAKEACSFRMLSIPREADRNTISQVISGRFGEVFEYAISERMVTKYDTQIYFTSGFRKGSQWVWEDGKQVEFDVGGEGRCLALSQGQWQAVNCDVPGIPLCEAAKECIEWGKYQGKRNRTTSGMKIKNPVIKKSLNIPISGLPCMKWNDPSVLSYGTIVNEQREWDHNYCRITDANR
uniref:C-type lectin domain-containing protein n=1 Tax=Heterorhabditis bacteriophora TaxID=37862 RepID=A0A1I7X7S8_HETBA